jgi:hypothetical protein
VRKSCPTCTGRVEQKRLGKLNAEHAPLKLSVDAMPAAVCAHNHAAAVDDDFMLWLIHELKDRATTLPAGEEKGALFKKFLCSCGAELPSKSERRKNFTQQLAYEGYPAFNAEIDMPVYMCTKCGKDQLRSAKQAQKHISQAIAALNDAAGFPHSG